MMCHAMHSMLPACALVYHTPRHNLALDGEKGYDNKKDAFGVYCRL
ncbi:hypothetical protein CIE15_000255 [Salmonella enterica subsp. enterica serovar Oranienburg]|nr:hypothetical protein [Salmonella enterica subsp. enterica serovar Oranienburg]